MVNTNIDMVFRGGDAHHGPRPNRLITQLICVGAYRSFKVLAGYCIYFMSVRSVLASRNFGRNLLSPITHGIALLPHLSLSLPSQSVLRRLSTSG